MSEILLDNIGRPSTMVKIKKFYLDEINAGFPHTVHPAFVVNGVEKDCFYVSKYLNSVYNERAYSVPMDTPKVSIGITAAKSYCTNKGSGWHLMTNAEWSAIQMICFKNSIYPSGNNNYGKDYTTPTQTGIEATKDGSNTALTLNGSGVKAWSHDNTIFGVYDLNGNAHEFIDGLKLINGAVAVKQNNNYADTAYSYIDVNGAYTSDYASAVKFDTDVAGDTTQTSHTVGGGTANAILKTSITNYLYTTDNTTNNNYGIIYPLFQTVTASGLSDGCITLLKSLGIYPLSTSLGGDGTSIRNYGERIATRGGSYNNTTKSGVFCFDFSNNSTVSNASIGFRSCYIG